MQLKQKNSESLNGIKKTIEDINNLDFTFNKMQEDTEILIKEARENYISVLKNFEVLYKQIYFVFEYLLILLHKLYVEDFF